MALIFYESSGPVASPALEAVPDYLLHCLAYSVLFILVYWAVHESLDGCAGGGGYSLPMLITVLYGISDEFHQSFVPSRNSEVRDVVADSLGGVLGILLILLLRSAISVFRRSEAA